MIKSVFEYLTLELNSYLKSKYRLNEDMVYSSALVGLDGLPAVPFENKLITTLVNVNQDTSGGSPGYSKCSEADQANVEYYPGISLNLLMLVSAHFNKKNYYEALGFLSESVSFFQKKPVFDRHNSPGMDLRIKKLALEIINLDTHYLGNLWGMHGGRYLPSILYKIRTITIDSNAVRSIEIKTSDIDSSAHIKRD